MSSILCKFCGKTYSAKRSLHLHQTTAKFCLKIQEEIKLKNESHENGMKNKRSNKKINDENIDEEISEITIKKTRSDEPISPKKDIESKNFHCEYCDNYFSLKHVYFRHQESCKEKLKHLREEEKNKKDELLQKVQEELKNLTTDYVIVKNDLKNERKMLEKISSEKDNLISNLKSERDNLMKQLIELKSTPTVNTTNNYNTTQTSTKVSNVMNVNNKLQLTEDFLTKLRTSISFKEQVFLDEEDICRWSLKNGLNCYFAVLDKSRKVLTFTDEKGNKVRDQDGVLLANKLYKEFCETIKNENAQEYLNSLNEDPNEMYVPTTLMRRKKLVQNVIAGNEYSVQRLGSSIFKEYPRYEPKILESDIKSSQSTIENKSCDKEDIFSSDNFSIVKSKIKNLFFKYNFDPLNYGLHTIGGFLYQFLDELEIRASRHQEYIEVKDDDEHYIRLNDKQLFLLMSDVFTEEDLVQIMLKCKTEEYTKNLIIFQKIFILKQFSNVENIIQNLYLGIRGAF